MKTARTVCALLLLVVAANVMALAPGRRGGDVGA